MSNIGAIDDELVQAKLESTRGADEFEEPQCASEPLPPQPVRLRAGVQATKKARLATTAYIRSVAQTLWARHRDLHTYQPNDRATSVAELVFDDRAAVELFAEVNRVIASELVGVDALESGHDSWLRFCSLWVGAAPPHATCDVSARACAYPFASPSSARPITALNPPPHPEMQPSAIWASFRRNTPPEQLAPDPHLRFPSGTRTPNMSSWQLTNCHLGGLDLEFLRNGCPFSSLLAAWGASTGAHQTGFSALATLPVTVTYSAVCPYLIARYSIPALGADTVNIHDQTNGIFMYAGLHARFDALKFTLEPVVESYRTEGDPAEYSIQMVLSPGVGHMNGSHDGRFVKDGDVITWRTENQVTHPLSSLLKSGHHAAGMEVFRRPWCGPGIATAYWRDGSSLLRRDGP
ncbi:hypothetical protein FN846DRAFT_889716 [Sphaerosporella brunnea]|uniref:Uncharacterized protein n=1 Tax=Sphaerosporella brunnea TaxID=1250544 RepID=A0A5J5EY86_9PEZI|nr:hypothetical protein FN846DRAFT_889716 [Sphaerosporella brunnea]